MTTKEKYTEILKEVVRNEAVSHDKLKMLAEKHGANKLKIQGYLRKAGVIEGMGNGVNRVLIRDRELDPYVKEILVLTKGGYKKKEKLDMSLPEKWHDEDPNTHARANEPKPYFDDPDMEAAENDIDMHAKMLEMVNSFIDKVQTNTNKQNEYITKLEKKVEGLEILLNNELENTGEKIIDIEQQIGGIQSHHNKNKKQIEILEHHRIIHDNQIQALQMITKGHKTEISNSGVLKAVHQLLGEIV